MNGYRQWTIEGYLSRPTFTNRNAIVNNMYPSRKTEVHKQGAFLTKVQASGTKI